MDSLASLALATEQPDENFLDRNPEEMKIRKDIIFPKMIKHILGQAFYQIIIMMIIVFDGNKKKNHINNLSN